MEQQGTPPKTRKKSAAADDGQKPVHTITVGAMAANIYLRQAPSGYAYYAYNLKRSYQSLTTKNQIHSTDFFADNKSDILAVVTQASLWIASQSERNKDSLQNAA